ncbi:UvrD-helicase domain-containing protein [Nakamurella sp. A5-74]|uniref:RecBCD enzyme subunit RecB n=1 Tax=Nakamurella sp. A5-74 TaxID=3158264 RepID=A0AAU8DRL6_9ACTN
MTARQQDPRVGRTMPMNALGDFDVTGDLPWQETVVLEASAGTGKTHTIASLAARYLAEGRVRLEHLMLVTFGRSATQELRDRVRGRLTELEQALRLPKVPSADEVATLLRQGTPEELAQRQRNLATALASFDEATIATTHSFCQRMLDGLGIAADHDPGAVLLENSDDVLAQVVGDDYLRRFAPFDDRPFDASTARQIARAATGMSMARLEPAMAVDPRSRPRVEFAEGIRELFDVRKRELHALDFDDLQVRLAEALVHPVRGGAARDLVRANFHVVLVDEFQDTDPVQWEILRTAFHGHSTLVLIGDPKQAIYAFRGADVHTYLRAARLASRQFTLGTNWRSDAPLVRALDSLWNAVNLGHPDITVRAIEAARPTSRLIVPGRSAPLRIRRVPRSSGTMTTTGYLTSTAAMTAIVRDLASEIVTLLESGATVIDPAAGPDAPPRPISPSDIAVLVRTNKEGEAARNALQRARIPAVLTGNTSVFSSVAAEAWDTLLHCLQAPNRADRARRVALTPFVGWTAPQTAAADQQQIEDLIDRIRGWAAVFADGGVAALLEAVGAAGLATRVLASADGDRLLTDIRHLAQVMNGAARDEHLGPAALLEWLRRRRETAERDASDELSRRLSTEAQAVQVLTVHRSKGLEFGAVFAPFAWTLWLPDEPDPLRLHDDEGNQLLDVGGTSGAGHAARLARGQQEALGEELRLLYVTFTRARSLLVTWWAPGWNAKQSPLHRLLFGELTQGTLPSQVPVPSDADAQRRFAEIATAAGGLIEIETADPVRRPMLTVREIEPVALSARSFDRAVDTTWRRTSYSGLTAAAHSAHYDGADPHADTVAGQGDPALRDQQEGDDPTAALDTAETGSEPAEIGVDDEPEIGSETVGGSTRTVAGGADGGAAAPGDAREAELRAIGSPLEAFPGGTAFGTVVHEVLEYLDTTAADLPAELRAHCSRVLGPRSGEGLDPELLAAALEPVFATPLGALAEQRTLADFTPADRLAEMSFELPLAGGDAPVRAGAVGAGAVGAGATLAEMAQVWQEAVEDGDPLADYPRLLEDRLLSGDELRGYLTGSIDAVLRVRDGAGTPRYLVADYKTNRLGTPGEALTAWDYRPEAMAEAMSVVHYPLQAILYTVALHRYLTWRQPGYDPDVHLGGSLYLFVRGMSGPQTPVVDGMPCGVFAWRPSSRIVLAVSDLLAGDRR